MIEVKFQNEEEEKTAYQFTRQEFSGLLKSLVWHGHPGERAIILSHDTKYKVRPVAKRLVESIERLSEVASRHNMVGGIATQTRLDVLRNERDDVVRAVNNPESGLINEDDSVYLGVFATAVAFDPLRAPLALQTQPTEEGKQILRLMDQFYTEGVDRLMERV